jgi:hypothetical protein
MNINPLYLSIKIISDCISNKYKSISSHEYQYWNIDLVNESEDMFILSCHNYDTNTYTPEKVKDPSGYSWYCFLDVLERSKHVIAKSLLQEQMIDFISPIDMLKHASLKDDCVEGFLDFLISKKIAKRNLATIKQLILNNKTTFIYLSLIKKGSPVFETIFDNDAKLFDKALILFQEWIKSKGIFSYLSDQQSKEEYPSRIENLSAFYEIFNINLLDIVEFAVNNKSDDAKSLLIDLIGIPEYDLNIPDIVKNSLPNLLIVKGLT